MAMLSLQKRVILAATAVVVCAVAELALIFRYLDQEELQAKAEVQKSVKSARDREQHSAKQAAEAESARDLALVAASVNSISTPKPALPNKPESDRLRETQAHPTALQHSDAIRFSDALNLLAGETRARPVRTPRGSGVHYLRAYPSAEDPVWQVIEVVLSEERLVGIELVGGASGHEDREALRSALVGFGVPAAMVSSRKDPAGLPAGMIIVIGKN